MKSLLKTLFLDIDGVLNSDRFHRSLQEDNFPYGLELDPKAMLLLKNFLDNHADVQVVISSSWRDTLSKEQFNELFSTYGIKNKVIDLTSSDMGKAESIELWIQTNNPTHVAILDDDQLFDLLHKLHQFQIKTSMGLGLQESHINSLKLFF